MPRRETTRTRVKVRAGEDWQAKAVRLNTLERNLLHAYLAGLALEHRLRLSILRQQTRPVERRSAALKTRLKSGASTLADDEIEKFAKQYRPPTTPSRFSATIRAYSSSMQRHLPTEMLSARSRLGAAGLHRDPLLGPSSDICPFCTGCPQPIARPLTGACIGGRQQHSPISYSYAQGVGVGRAPRVASAAGALGSTARLSPEVRTSNERDRPAFWFQAPATSTRSLSRCRTHSPSGTPSANDLQQSPRAMRHSNPDKPEVSSRSASAPDNDTIAVQVKEYLEEEEQLGVRREDDAEREEAAASATATNNAIGSTAQKGRVNGYGRAVASAPARRSSIPKAEDDKMLHSVLRRRPEPTEMAPPTASVSGNAKDRTRAHVRVQSPELTRTRDANAVAAERPASSTSSVSESASATAAGVGMGAEEPRRFVIPQVSLVSLERSRLASCLARKDAFLRRALSGSSFVRPYHSGNQHAE